MLQFLRGAWPLLFGIFLLQIGNGLQGSLIGIRGSIEAFTTTELSIITSGYFVGFLFGSRMTPDLIRNVGHVRVFAALGSFVSAVLILYPILTEVWAWFLLRVVFGFSFSGVYVTAESWLNNSTTNENRGKSLSLYMIVQMMGIVLSQSLLNVADPAGFVLFIIPSVLVSLSFAPILLAATPMPAQLTRMRGVPSAACTAAMPAATESGSTTSTRWNTPPSSAARASPASALRSKSATLTPSAASRRAVAAPSPEAPPVTIAE